jgi:hypothetical protein
VTVKALASLDDAGRRLAPFNRRKQDGGGSRRYPVFILESRALAGGCDATPVEPNFEAGSVGN